MAWILPGWNERDGRPVLREPVPHRPEPLFPVSIKSSPLRALDVVLTVGPFSIRYDFSTGNQAGTYWYHSHLSTQYCDGLRSVRCVFYARISTEMRLRIVGLWSSTVRTLLGSFQNPSEVPFQIRSTPRDTSTTSTTVHPLLSNSRLFPDFVISLSSHHRHHAGRLVPRNLDHALPQPDQGRSVRTPRSFISPTTRI